MNDLSSPLPTLADVKAQAKRLRASLVDSGIATSHSQALERLAHQFGFRDWNTFHAAIGNHGLNFPPALGDRVSGWYLGHRFDAEVIGIRSIQPGNRYRMTLKFDEAVDVVSFEGMSSFRKRVTSTVGRDGKTVEKTSNGVPQLVLDI